jgi:hypothetical protein
MAKTTKRGNDKGNNLRKIAKILLKETTHEILEAIDECFSFIGNPEYEMHLKKIIIRAVELADEPEEAMSIFHFLRTGNYLQSTDDEELTFKKALSLCNFKQDVENEVMGYFYENPPNLNDEKYFYAIFERGKELNSN